MCNISKTINQTLVFRQPTYSRYGLIGVKCSISSQCQYIISIPIHIFDIVGGFKIINLVREISTNQYCPPSAYLPILTINSYCTISFFFVYLQYVKCLVQFVYLHSLYSKWYTFSIYTYYIYPTFNIQTAFHYKHFVLCITPSLLHFRAKLFLI